MLATLKLQERFGRVDSPPGIPFPFLHSTRQYPFLFCSVVLLAHVYPSSGVLGFWDEIIAEPAYRQWYLGERIVQQSLHFCRPVVPVSPLADMFRGNKMTPAEVAQHFTGVQVSEDLIVFGANYAAFVANSLAPHGVVEYRRGEVAVKPSSRRGCRGDGGQPDLLVLDWIVVGVTSDRSNRVTEVLVPSNLPFTLPSQLDQVPLSNFSFSRMLALLALCSF